MAMLVDISEDFEIADDFDARCLDGHQDHRLLLVILGIWIRLAHHDQDLASLIHCARRPPLCSIDYIVIALAPD